MYKQTVWGIRSPVISIIFQIFITLLYTSGLEAVYKTSMGSFWYYLISTAIFALLSLYIFIATVTKYEYAILDNELILRKFINKEPKRIYSVKLIRSNCIYYNKGKRHFAPLMKNTHNMYIMGFGLFKRKCAVVFADTDGTRIKLIFKPDKALDEEIYRIKTTQW